MLQLTLEGFRRILYLTFKWLLRLLETVKAYLHSLLVAAPYLVGVRILPLVRLVLIN